MTNMLFICVFCYFLKEMPLERKETRGNVLFKIISEQVEFSIKFQENHRHIPPDTMASCAWVRLIE